MSEGDRARFRIIDIADFSRPVGGEMFWDVADETGAERKVKGPREFQHALRTLVNVPIKLGFSLLGIWEDFDDADASAQLVTWKHFCAVAPPWLTFWRKLSA